MNRKRIIWYCYPTHHTVSFTLVARKHIDILRQEYKVEEIPEVSLFNIVPYSRPSIIIHPFFYMIYKRRESWPNLRMHYEHVIACDVADSDRLSPECIDYINCCNAVITNSTWSKEAYVRSGCKVPVYIVPHGVDDVYGRPPREPQHPTIRYLMQLKHRKQLKYLLFFFWHSGYRKGADLVYRAVHQVQKLRKDVVLIIKCANIMDSYMGTLQSLTCFTVKGWMDQDTLVDLYDICDVVLLFSRGGSFELNGLEALARGKILLAPDKGAWLDYIPKQLRKYSLIKTHKMVEVLPGNDIHVGLGAEIDVDAAAQRILDVCSNFEEYKAAFEEAKEDIFKQWNWRAIAPKLLNAVGEIVN